MADVVGLQRAAVQVPHLNILVPAGGDDDWVLVVGREPDASTRVTSIVLSGSEFGPLGPNSDFFKKWLRNGSEIRTISKERQIELKLDQNGAKFAEIEPNWDKIELNSDHFHTRRIATLATELFKST